MFGFYRLAAVTPTIMPAGVAQNLAEHRRLYHEAVEHGASLVLFPELSLTGATCGDLFSQDALLDAACRAAWTLAGETGDAPAVFGLPLVFGDRIYDVAAIAQDGRIRAFIPHTRPTASRVFSKAAEALENQYGWDDAAVPFLPDTLFDAGSGLIFGIAFDAEDALRRSAEGARLLLVPAASPELAGSAAGRRQELAVLSRFSQASLLYAGAGRGESTTSGVCAGAKLLAEAGRITAETRPFDDATPILYADADLEKAGQRRRQSPPPSGSWASSGEIVALETVEESPDLTFAHLNAHPFVPADPAARDVRSAEVLQIQSEALAGRLRAIHAQSAVLGISGGLDSTLALLVTVAACRLAGLPAERVLALTMPGFGTSERTRGNASELCRLLGVRFREIPISQACLAHFQDIGHDPAVHNAVYENAQARERTQILMDLANAENGIVIGTGDLSEGALGWCTYNGDQMSMYAVNADVPKTLIPAILEMEAKRSSPELARILRDIVDTPVSPELLPADAAGAISQKTEEIVGPYELHDFFLYEMIRNGTSADKTLALAEAAFAGKYAAREIKKYLAVFRSRFFRQQFKRNCAPDGPTVGSLSLSPFAGWVMPSDADGTLWL